MVTNTRLDNRPWVGYLQLVLEDNNQGGIIHVYSSKDTLIVHHTKSTILHVCDGYEGCNTWLKTKLTKSITLYFLIKQIRENQKRIDAPLL